MAIASTRPPHAAWYPLALLILAYIAAYIDRTMMTLLVHPIRASLHIGDLGFGLLQGTAFALFYTTLGLPLGRIADRGNRCRLITGGIVLWSVMTALCGVARSFAQMFVFRIGVGVGEAALSPAAYSLLGDWFPPAWRAIVLSLFVSAIYAGSGLALLFGGALIHALPAVALPGGGMIAPWQSAFLAVALPGLLIAALMAGVREPPRRGELSQAPPSLSDTWRFLRARRRVFAPLFAGYAAAALIWNGAQTWYPAFLMRRFDWDTGMVGFRLGLVLLICGSAGACAGGAIAAWRRRRGSSAAEIGIGIISVTAALPAVLLAVFAAKGMASLLFWCAFTFAGALPYGAAASAIQQITPNRMRGQVSALYLLGVNLAGLGCGPLIVGALTQHFFRADAAVGLSIAATALLASPVALILLLSAQIAFRRTPPVHDAPAFPAPEKFPHDLLHAPP